MNVVLSLANDSGVSSSDGLTNDTTVNVSGLESTSKWEYSTNGGSSWSMPLAAAVTTFELLPNNMYAAEDIQVRVTDVAGNVQITKMGAVITDTTDPSFPSFIGEDFNINEGLVKVGDIIGASDANNVTYSLTGGFDNAHFEIVNGNELQFNAGAFDFENPLSGADASVLGKLTYEVEVQATDDAGNSTSKVIEVTVDDVTGEVSYESDNIETLVDHNFETTIYADGSSSSGGHSGHPGGPAVSHPGGGHHHTHENNNEGWVIAGSGKEKHSGTILDDKDDTYHVLGLIKDGKSVKSDI